MNSSQQSEMDKLRAIQSQLSSVTDRIATRLPTQHRHLAALVCARKWRLTTLSKLRPQTLQQEAIDVMTKKMRMEIGAFEYSTKEQSELLTRALFQLDDILSHGDVEIKETRKALVLSIQAQLERADVLKASAARLKEFTERIIACFPTLVEEVANEEEAASTEPATESVTTDATMNAAEEERGCKGHDEDDLNEEEAPQQNEATEVDQGTDETMDDASKDEEEQVEDEEEDVEEEGEDDDDEDDGEEDVEDEGEEEDAEDEEEEGDAEEEKEEEDAEDERNGDPEEVDIDIQSLPVYRPYYQIQQRADGVYIQANLHGVDPRHVRVEAMPQTGIVRISGFKLPTQKDLMLSRLSGQPTFGRFAIVERFPTNQLSLDHATQQFSQDGTLHVRLPFFVVQRPCVVRRVSPFQPHRLAVW